MWSVKKHITCYLTSGNLHRKSPVFAAEHWIAVEVKSHHTVMLANDVLVTLRTNCVNMS